MKDLKYLQFGRKEYIKNNFFVQFPTFKAVVQYAHKIKDQSLLSVIGFVMAMEDGKSEGGIFGFINMLKAASVPSAKGADFSVVTGHKSKGLEWDTVEILDDFPYYKKRKKIENQTEELNLLYVTITRARQSIHIPENIANFLENNCQFEI